MSMTGLEMPGERVAISAAAPNLVSATLRPRGEEVSLGYDTNVQCGVGCQPLSDM